MATYKQLSCGSSGQEVKDLQTALNKAGNYNLDIDGNFGPATQNAVKDYQQKNSLSVDGIAGEQTLGKLYAPAQTDGGGTAEAPAQAQQSTTPKFDPNTSEAYSQAMQALNDAKNNAPTYEGTYDQAIKDAYDQIVNRPKFSYDVNEDALYEQLRDNYDMQGRMAAMDAAGQAAALAGGYGSSYGQQVAQQTHQGYLQKLNDVVPELYGMAADRYDREGQQMMNQYAMLGDLQANEYARYQDRVNQHWQDVNFAYQQAQDAYGKVYDQYNADLQADELAYNRKQNAYNNLVSMITSTGYQPTARELEEAGMSNEQAASFKQYYAKSQRPTYSGGGGGGSTVNPGSYKPYGSMTETEFFDRMYDYAATGERNAALAFAEMIDTEEAYQVFRALFPTIKDNQTYVTGNTSNMKF